MITHSLQSYNGPSAQFFQQENKLINSIFLPPDISFKKHLTHSFSNFKHSNFIWGWGGGSTIMCDFIGLSMTVITKVNISKATEKLKGK